jgi:hypothetical protein
MRNDVTMSDPIARRAGRHDRVRGRRRWEEMKLVKSGIGLRRHYPRQILWVGEKCEDARDRERNPGVDLEIGMSGGFALLPEV